MTFGPTISSLPSESDTWPAGTVRHLDRRWILAVAVIVVFIVDQVSKEIALHGLIAGPAAVGGLRFRLVANHGILLGFPAPTALVVLATVAVIIVAIRASRGAGVVPAIAYGLVVGGALGNLADRFQDRHFFPPAAVVDWIAAGRITFNLADAFLLAAMMVLLAMSSRRDTKDATQPAI